MSLHEKFMTRCLVLAKNGLGLVYPNPMVGSVLVYNDVIIGEGWHQKAGGPHAEVVAIGSVKKKELIPESTLYVNLEPCSHHGRTPPCADLIIKSGIKKVVIGVVDSNEKVGGRGVRRLKESGVEVIINVEKKACRELNKRFFTFHEKKRPYVVLKWAQSSDGYIVPEAEKVSTGKPFWISNEFSRQRVHQWRTEEESILVGKKTALNDNPKLNVRDFIGNSLLRTVIDKNLELSPSSNLFDQSIKTLVFNNLKNEAKENLEFVKLDFSQDLVVQVMEVLFRKGVQSLIVEGGAFTLNEFIQSRIWDEARVFQGSHSCGSGIKAPELSGRQEYEETIDDDVLRFFTNNS